MRYSSSCVLMVVGASSGCGGWAPSSRPSGFRKWVPSPSGPFPAVLCPSIGRPGGAGVRRLGCRGAAAGLLSALPRHSSCSIVPIPMPFSSPISIPGLFWSISPWSWFPRLLWSLLHSLLQASTAFCSWCCRPRGHGIRSSPSPISFSLWTCHTFSWSPFRLCSCR